MIIAFGHQKQMGKDTAVNAISERILCNYVALADPLYEICEIMQPDFENKFYYDKYPYKKNEKLNCGKTPRELLIATGQKLKEVYGKHCWVDIAIAGKRTEVLLISDLRYKEEAKRLKEYGAIFVKVFRPGVEVSSDSADDDLLYWDGWDHILVNDCSLKKFKMKAIDLYERIINDKCADGMARM